MQQKVLTTDSQEAIVSEVTETTSNFATRVVNAISKKIASMTTQQKKINAGVGSRFSNPQWVEETQKRELEAYNLRSKMGELTYGLIQAQKNGDEKLVSEFRREQELVKQKLSKL